LKVYQIKRGEITNVLSMHRNYLPDTYTEYPKKFTIPVDLSTFPEEIMNFWMCRFITEKDTSQGWSNCAFLQLQNISILG